jgi:ketosteroid isomerase-like protein
MIWIPSWTTSQIIAFSTCREAPGRAAINIVGKDVVRAGLAKRFEGIPDVHYGDDRHWACGNFGVSEWTLTGTSVSGQHIEVRGVDLLEFDEGKIIRKDSFWKILE